MISFRPLTKDTVQVKVEISNPYLVLTFHSPITEAAKISQRYLDASGAVEAELLKLRDTITKASSS